MDTLKTELSVCIPVYQNEVKDLVRELKQQAQLQKIGFEILLWDDDSDVSIKAKNRQLIEWPEVRYHELPKNVGRSKIRNLLMEAAEGEFLLFLDNDSKVTEPGFIENYWREKLVDGVVCGGTLYNLQKQVHSLHFTYATQREVKSLQQRINAGAKGFHSNNFIMARSVADRIAFNEELTQYGHEDTLFGLELHRAGIPVKHIQNPVEHTQLESNVEFIRKTQKGLENLAFIWRELKELDLDFFPLLKLAAKLFKSRLYIVYLLWYRHNRKKWLNNLHSARPALKVFDLYRLGYLLTKMSEKRI